MKPVEIVELIKKSNPDLLGEIPDAKAANIIRAAFAQLRKKIGSTKEGAIEVSGFGDFMIRQVEREKDGEKKNVKMIGFRVAKQQVKKGIPAANPKAGNGKPAAKQPPKKM